jgi:type I restriction enzyme S subunit
MNDDVAQLLNLAENVTEKVAGRAKRPDIPYVGLEHLMTDNPRVQGSVPASESVSVNTVFRPGDVLFGKLRPNLRKVAIAGIHGYCSTDILVLRPTAGNDYSFVSHVLRSQKVLDLAAGTAFGTKMPRTSWELLKHAAVFKPGLSEQRCIAEILDTLDDRICVTGEIIDKLTRIRRGLLDDLMGRGIDSSGRLREDVSTDASLYQVGPHGPCPRGWTIGLLDEFAQRGSGHTPNKLVPSYWNGGVKWVSLADSSKLDRLYIFETDKEISDLGIANSSAVKHPAVTVILSRDAGVGKSAILGREMAVSQHFMAWRTGPKLNNIYLYYWLQFMKRHFEAIAFGSTIQTIGLPFFRQLSIAVPPLDEQYAVTRYAGR